MVSVKTNVQLAGCHETLQHVTLCLSFHRKQQSSPSAQGYRSCKFHNKSQPSGVAAFQWRGTFSWQASGGRAVDKIAYRVMHWHNSLLVSVGVNMLKILGYVDVDYVCMHSIYLSIGLFVMIGSLMWGVQNTGKWPLRLALSTILHHLEKSSNLNGYYFISIASTCI